MGLKSSILPAIYFSISLCIYDMNFLSIMPYRSYLQKNHHLLSTKMIPTSQYERFLGLKYSIYGELTLLIKI